MDVDHWLIELCILIALDTKDDMNLLVRTCVASVGAATGPKASARRHCVVGESSQTLLLVLT